MVLSTAPFLGEAKQKGGIFMARKKMYQRPDGLYEKKLVIGGKRVAFRAKTEREVMQKIAAYQQKEEMGPLFVQVAQEWWADKQPRLSPNTAPNYQLAMRRAVEHFGQIPAKEITPVTVKGYLQQMARKGYARRTVNQHFVVLREICAWACENYNVLANPAALVKLPDNLAQTKRKMPTEEDIERIKSMKDTPDGLFLNFLLYTGLRLGEALAVRWGDIDPVKEIIEVHQSLYFAGKNQGELKEPKTEAGQRRVIYLKKLQSMLEPFRTSDEKFVFGKGDKPMSKRAYDCLRQRCRKTGLNVTPHQLRHAYATLLFEAGVPEKTAQNLMGHAQLSTTMDIYTELREKKLTEAASLLNGTDI